MLAVVPTGQFLVSSTNHDILVPFRTCSSGASRPGLPPRGDRGAPVCAHPHACCPGPTEGGVTSVFSSANKGQKGPQDPCPLVPMLSVPPTARHRSPQGAKPPPLAGQPQHTGQAAEPASPGDTPHGLGRVTHAAGTGSPWDAPGATGVPAVPHVLMLPGVNLASCAQCRREQGTRAALRGKTPREAGNKGISLPSWDSKAWDLARSCFRKELWCWPLSSFGSRL